MNKLTVKSNSSILLEEDNQKVILKLFIPSVLSLGRRNDQL